MAAAPYRAGAVDARTTSAGADGEYSGAGSPPISASSAPRRRLAELRVVDAHRRERRRGERGQRRVVEAGDREVAGHVEPAARAPRPRPPAPARRSRRRPRSGSGRAARAPPRAASLAGVHDRPAGSPRRGRAPRASAPRAPARARTPRRPPRNADPLVAERRQVLDRRRDPLVVARLDPRERARRRPGRPASTTGTPAASSSAKRGSSTSTSVSRKPSTRPAAASRS